MVGAIIPARCGSKGVANKNLRVVGGETLLGRAIETCHAAGLSTVVSSECQLIQEEARSHHAAVHFRPWHLAEDHVVSWEVLRSAAQVFPFETIVWVQCTAPLLTPRDLLNCVEALNRGDLSVAVHETHSLDLTVVGSGLVKPLFMVPAKRRQDLPARYSVSGSCWAFRRDYLDSRECYEGTIVPVLSENPRRLDIDDEHDLEYAEFLISKENELAAY